jgi:hypothetical protein
MGLLNHRSIRYIVLHSFKICVNALFLCGEDCWQNIDVLMSSILKAVWILVFML